ncbi:MAG: hypothetical protein WC856_02395 [Methylococcaceae bacterium]|jgi:hypothetical protein
MMTSGAEKLKLIRELKTIRGDMPASNGVNKLTMVRRIKEIRVLLSGKAEKAGRLVIDPNDKQASFKALEEYAINSIKAMPEALRRTESKTIQAVYGIVNQLPGDKLSPEQISEMREVFKEYDAIPEESAFSYFAKSGDIFDDNADKIKSTLDAIVVAQHEDTNDSPEVIKKKMEIFEESINIRTEIDDIASERYRLENGESGFVDGDYTRLSDKLKELYARIDELDRLEYDISREKYNNKQAKIEAIREQLKEPGKIIIDTLLSVSKVTQEQAEQWANAQVIDKASITQLGKQGYQKADIRRDMAEFYRISGGKLRNIAITANGSRRANASGIGAIEDTEIHPGSRFDKEVLWHELAHHLEADPAAKQASNDFLLKRREGANTYTLRSLTGNMGYNAKEIAYKDDFISEYIGKVYYDQTTEVWSMGVQYLSNPETAASFIAKDPEMAKLIAGYLQADLSPAMKALQQVQDVTAQNNQRQRSDIESQYQDVIKRLASDVELVDDGWFGNLEERMQQYLIAGGGRINDPNAKYIGTWHNQRVFSGKFKPAYGPRRVKKGFAVGKFADSEGPGNGITLYPLLQDLNIVKAILSLAEHDNASFSNTIAGLFMTDWKSGKQDPNKEMIVRSANRIFGEPQ